MSITISSIPASFTITAGSPQNVIFNIPAGLYSSGYWETETFTGFPVPSQIQNIATPLDNVNMPATDGSLQITTANLTATQIGEVNNSVILLVTISTDTFAPLTVNYFNLVIDQVSPNNFNPAINRKWFRKMRTKILAPIYVRANIANLTSPFGIQIVREFFCNEILFQPGIMYLNGVISNSQIGMRLYKGEIGDKTSVQAYTERDLPVYSQVCDIPGYFGFDGVLNAFIGFHSLTSPIPANSQIEFTLIPSVFI